MNVPSLQEGGIFHRSATHGGCRISHLHNYCHTRRQPARQRQRRDARSGRPITLIIVLVALPTNASTFSYPEFD